MSRVHSFEPVIGVNPRLIILGSMPGVVSLQQIQYYANPRNAFWRIMADIFGIEAEASYQTRLEQISAHPVILWDSLRACVRPGSLDAKIDSHSAEANDIAGLLERFPAVQAIIFNGAASEKFFRQLVLPTLPPGTQPDLLRMPSTSPANAGMNFDDKLNAWREMRRYL